MKTLVVFDLESHDAPMPLGVYVRTDEDTVIYTRPAGDHGYAPADCVAVAAVDVMRGNLSGVEAL